MINNNNLKTFPRSLNRSARQLANSVRAVNASRVIANGLVGGGRALRRERRLLRRAARRAQRAVNVPVVNNPVNVSRSIPVTQIAKPNRTPTLIGQGLRALGGLAGSYFGQPALGTMAGAGISRIFGQGDYVTNSVTANTLMSGAPSFSPLTSGFRIQHREYIKDIQSSINFTATPFAINPGDPVTFPWLSTVAQNFEEYRIHGMVVYLNTTSATAVSSTNTALGVWGAVTQYDPSEPIFGTKQQCENYVGCVSAVPAHSLLHGIECKRNSNVLNKMYVRNAGDSVAVEDLKFYDWGNLVIFTSGSQAVSTIGEMWISYDIEFTKPKVSSSVTNATTWTFYGNSSAGQSFGAGTVYPDAAESSTREPYLANNILVFPPSVKMGRFFVTVQWVYGSTQTPGTSTAPVVNGPGISIDPYFDTYTSSLAYAPAAGVASTRAIQSFVINRTQQTQNGITFSNGFGITGSYTMTVTGLRQPGTTSTVGVHKLSLTELDQLRALLSKTSLKVLAHKEEVPFHNPQELQPTNVQYDDSSEDDDYDDDDAPSYEQISTVIPVVDPFVKVHSDKSEAVSVKSRARKQAV